MTQRFYTVRPNGGGAYIIVDAKTGNIVNRFNIPGELYNGPIVSGDSCTIVTRVGNIQTGYVVKIPTGNIINRFSGGMA
jgi:hypothetical protein